MVQHARATIWSYERSGTRFNEDLDHARTTCHHRRGIALPHGAVVDRSLTVAVPDFFVIDLRACSVGVESFALGTRHSSSDGYWFSVVRIDDCAGMALDAVPIG